MNCLITGATGGIGRSICGILKDFTKTMNVVGSNENKLIQLQNDIQNNSNTIVKYFQCDFRNFANVECLINSFESYKLDVLINSAGIFDPKPLNEVNSDQFDDQINVNLKTPFFLMKMFQRQASKSGIIINIGSSSSYSGFSNNSMYCLTKHAILGASRSLFEEFKSDGIRVYCISPSGTKTSMGEKILGEDYKTFLNPEEISNFIKYIIMNSDSNMIMNEVFLKRFFS
jgi:short-subunit dehydrogenase